MSGTISAMGLPHSAPGRELPQWLVTFYHAYIGRDSALLDAILHEDIDWLLAGPSEQIDYYGYRRGKAAAIEVVTRIMPCFLHLTDFEIEHLTVQPERAALYGNLRARQRDTARSLCFRCAHFLRVRDGRIVSVRGIADTFDIAEQLVGHRIDITQRIEQVSLAPDGDDLLLTL